MRPAERQGHLAGFDLRHRLVGAVAIDVEDPRAIVAEVSFGNVVGTRRVEHEDHRFLGREHPQHPAKIGFVRLLDEDEPTRLVAMPVPGAAIVFDELVVERLEQRHQFLQTADDRAARQIQAVTAQFGEGAIQRYEERELAAQDLDPDGNAEVAFGNELVGRRRREQRRLTRTGARAALARIIHLI